MHLLRQSVASFLNVVSTVFVLILCDCIHASVLPMLSISSPSVKTLCPLCLCACVNEMLCPANPLCLFWSTRSPSSPLSPTPLAPLCYLRLQFVVLRLLHSSFPFRARLLRCNYSFGSRCTGWVSPRPVHLHLLLPLFTHTSSCLGSA